MCLLSDAFNKIPDKKNLLSGIRAVGIFYDPERESRRPSVCRQIGVIAARRCLRGDPMVQLLAPHLPRADQL